MTNLPETPKTKNAVKIISVENLEDNQKIKILAKSVSCGKQIFKHRSPLQINKELQRIEENDPSINTPLREKVIYSESVHGLPDVKESNFIEDGLESNSMPDMKFGLELSSSSHQNVFQTGNYSLNFYIIIASAIQSHLPNHSFDVHQIKSQISSFLITIFINVQIEIIEFSKEFLLLSVILICEVRKL